MGIDNPPPVKIAGRHGRVGGGQCLEVVSASAFIAFKTSEFLALDTFCELLMTFVFGSLTCILCDGRRFTVLLADREGRLLTVWVKSEQFSSMYYNVIRVQ